MTDKFLANVINEMSNAQQVIIGGDSKKEYVMTKLKEHMNKDDYERYQPMISSTIDFIKCLSTNKDILNALKNKKCVSCISKYYLGVMYKMKWLDALKF